MIIGIHGLGVDPLVPVAFMFDGAHDFSVWLDEFPELRILEVV